MIALPQAIGALLAQVPPSAWPSLETILRSAVHVGDENDTLVRLEALAAHAALHAFVAADEEITRKINERPRFGDR